MLKKPDLPRIICFLVLLGLPIIKGVQKMSMISLSNPTILIKLICVGSASTSHYLEHFFTVVGRMATLFSFLVFSTKSGYPVVDHDI